MNTEQAIEFSIFLDLNLREWLCGNFPINVAHREKKLNVCYVYQLFYIYIEEVSQKKKKNNVKKY